MDSGTDGMGHTMGYRDHMTFFWGKDAEILFSGWPGSSGGMYTLALIIVFVLAVLVEWFNFSQVISPRWSYMVARLAQTAMHAVRVALAYFVMLAVMSFNGGVLIAAILGHALGFFLFNSAALKSSDGCTVGDLPPIAC